VQFPKTQFVVGSHRFVRPASKIDNLRCDLASAAVKENGAISALHPQNITSVMRLGFVQNKPIRIPLVGRDVKTVHSGMTGVSEKIL
jgi:phosphotransferase system HPr-like phosphotransfer protein